MGKFADKLVGKKIVIIGGTSGIGYGAADALLDLGAHVTVVSSSPDRVDDAVRRLRSTSASVNGVVGDVRDEPAFIETLRKLAPIDHIIFSSVDKIIRGKLEDLDLDEAKHFFGVKFWGAVIVGKGEVSIRLIRPAFWLANSSFPIKAIQKYDIVKPGGSLTLTSGTAGIKPGKGAAVGGGLNGAILSLTKGLASDLAEKKIRVNTVVPGLVQTELWDKLGRPKEQEEQVAVQAKSLPVGFVATPSDTAEAYVYAVRADYATGTLIEIDGGRLL
ncbi:NAD(P)-binding protein [Lepidopterella palustris CBS 459.81]|uniref:NAD(P)-binding protein n=1 Tax=Lepidopterella palustris CBS 459.81 TaxID=1314670 RepID=A0A8E2DYN4_9PEZI|nr:NAD(P)-binding protein [Lepidopterella palustris CBS 459.81]